MLLPVAAVADTASPAAEYLAAVNQATWLSSLAAAGLALLLGLFLFRQIVAPVRALTKASRNIAAGDLEQPRGHLARRDRTIGGHLQPDGRRPGA